MFIRVEFCLFIHYFIQMMFIILYFCILACLCTVVCFVQLLFIRVYFVSFSLHIWLILLYTLFRYFLNTILCLICTYVCHFYVHCSIIVHSFVLLYCIYLFACLYTFACALFIIVLLYSFICISICSLFCCVNLLYYSFLST